MNTFNDTLLMAIDRLSGRLGLITTFMDRMIDFLAPKAIVQAACPPANAVCVIDMGCSNCCANCSGDYLSWHAYWYSTYPACEEYNGHCTACDYC